MKNPRLMTARQRAMLEKEKRMDGADETFPVIPAEPLLALPTGILFLLSLQYQVKSTGNEML